MAQVLKFRKIALPRNTVKLASSSFSMNNSMMSAISSPFRFAARGWSSFSARSPYSASILTGGTILCCSDVTAQWITQWAMSREHRRPLHFQWDRRRTLALSTFGALYFGLVCKRVYHLYDYVFLKLNNRRWMAHRRDSRCARPWNGKQIATYKSLVDCCVHMPLGIMPAFFGITGLIKGQSVEEIVAQFRAEWLTASLTSCVYWIPLMIFQFLFVPVGARTFYISIVSFFQKVALSWYTNRARMMPASEDGADGEVKEVVRELPSELTLPLCQERDVDNAIEALHNLGMNLTDADARRVCAI
jgi:hypothetical protein